MPEITEKREASTIDWSALEGDFGSGAPTTAVIPEVKDEVKVEEKDPNEITPPEPKTDEVKPEEVKPEIKPEGEVKPEGDVKPEDKKEEEPVIELKLDDVKGYKPAAEDGTWKSVGELFEVELADESPEAFVAAVEAKYKPLIEEARQYSIENEYSKLKPETVTALKLIEMGYPEDQAFNPTAKHADLLKLDDASIVRTNLEGLEGWDQERVDLEMESLSNNPALLKHEALKLKEWLTNDANRISAEREALVQQYTQNKDKAVLQQREQQAVQLKEAVMAVDSFLGAKINPEAKSAILQKHSRGDYGNILNDGKSLAEYLYFKEFGNKILDETRKSSYAKGKEEYTKQMLNIPTKPGEVSNKVMTEKIANSNQSSNGLDALKGDFG